MQFFPKLGSLLGWDWIVQILKHREKEEEKIPENSETVSEELFREIIAYVEKYIKNSTEISISWIMIFDDLKRKLGEKKPEWEMIYLDMDLPGILTHFKTPKKNYVYFTRGMLILLLSEKEKSDYEFLIDQIFDHEIEEMNAGGIRYHE